MPQLQATFLHLLLLASGVSQWLFMPTLARAEQRPAVRADENGSLHISSSLNGTVFINGHDLGAFLHLASLLPPINQSDPPAQPPSTPPAEHVYAIAGFANSNYLASVEIYDGNSWSPGPTLPSGLLGVSAAVFLGRIHVVGGQLYGSHIRDVRVLDSGEWQAAAPLPASRSRSAAVVYRDLLYVIGGYTGASDSRTVYTFDGTAWTEAAASLNEARRGAGAAVFDDRIFVVAGSGLASVEVFDGVSWRTDVAPQLPIPLSELTVSVFMGRLHVLGGNQQGTRIATVHVLDGSDAQAWSTTTPLPSPRGDSASVVFKGQLIVAGGFAPNLQLDTVVALSSDGTWSLLPPMNSAREDFVLVAI